MQAAHQKAFSEVFHHQIKSDIDIIARYRNQCSSDSVETIEEFTIGQHDLYPQELPWFKLLLHVKTQEKVPLYRKKCHRFVTLNNK